MSAGQVKLSYARSGFAITPGATALAATTKGIYVGAAGNITVTFADGASAQFLAVPTGSILPVQAVKVTAATATGLIGLV